MNRSVVKAHGKVVLGSFRLCVMSFLAASAPLAAKRAPLLMFGTIDASSEAHLACLKLKGVSNPKNAHTCYRHNRQLVVIREI
jgi:hypothetical protein